ncbi:MAG: hypothetical protein ACI4JZ_07955 [Oscillospiraceae bacterium]
MKKSGLRACVIIGAVLAFALILFGILFQIPSKKISISSYITPDWSIDAGKEYVGGDAYNYQMEASLKAGWVSGAMAVKAITISSGIILLVICFVADTKLREMSRQNELLYKISESVKNETVNQ